MSGTFASMKAEPWALSQERFDRFLAALDAHWGEGVLVGSNAPSLRNDEAFVQSFGRLERAAASPGAIVALFRADYESDVLHVLPSIRVPTLILHRKGDSLVPVAVGRDLAQKIPAVKYVELTGEDHMLQALFSVALVVGKMIFPCVACPPDAKPAFTLLPAPLETPCEQNRRNLAEDGRSV